jgi:hypothetical protein
MATAAVGTLPTDSLTLGLRPRDIDELRGLVGITEPPTNVQLGPVNELFKRIAEAVEGLAVRAIEKRTELQFKETIVSVFNDYVRLLRARSDLHQVLLKGNYQHVGAFVIQGITELENELRSEGPERFGNTITEQAVFTTWTLRKTADLVWRFPRVGTPEYGMPSPEDRRELEKLGGQFALYMSWAQFHLECLMASIRTDKAIYPDVHPAIMEGLRSEVNAYAIARQIMDLLSPAKEEDLPAYAWDEEDEELLASSMEDMEAEQEDL